MKRKIAAGSVAVVALVALSLVVASAAAKPDFSGKWMLAADGKTMTIEITFSGEQGTQKTRRVFVKQ